VSDAIRDAEQRVAHAAALWAEREDSSSRGDLADAVARYNAALVREQEGEKMSEEDEIAFGEAITDAEARGFKWAEARVREIAREEYHARMGIYDDQKISFGMVRLAELDKRLAALEQEGEPALDHADIEHILARHTDALMNDRKRIDALEARIAPPIEDGTRATSTTAPHAAGKSGIGATHSTPGQSGSSATTPPPEAVTAEERADRISRKISEFPSERWRDTYVTEIRAAEAAAERRGIQKALNCVRGAKMSIPQQASGLFRAGEAIRALLDETKETR